MTSDIAEKIKLARSVNEGNSDASELAKRKIELIPAQENVPEEVTVHFLTPCPDLETTRIIFRNPPLESPMREFVFLAFVLTLMTALCASIVLYAVKLEYRGVNSIRTFFLLCAAFSFLFTAWFKLSSYLNTRIVRYNSVFINPHERDCVFARTVARVQCGVTMAAILLALCF